MLLLLRLGTIAWVEVPLQRAGYRPLQPYVYIRVHATLQGKCTFDHFTLVTGYLAYPCACAIG